MFRKPARKRQGLSWTWEGGQGLAKEEKHSGRTAEKVLREMRASLALPGEGAAEGTEAEEACPCTWKSLPRLP